MVATRCRDRGSASGADGVTAAAATIGVILAGSNTVSMAAALTAAIASSVPAGSCPASSSAATSSTTAASTATAAALSQCRTYGQNNDSESEHEHTEDCHVACLPGSLMASRGSRVHLLTAPLSRAQPPGEHAPCLCVGPSKNASCLQSAADGPCQGIRTSE